MLESSYVSCGGSLDEHGNRGVEHLQEPWAVIVDFDGWGAIGSPIQAHERDAGNWARHEIHVHIQLSQGEVKRVVLWDSNFHKPAPILPLPILCLLLYLSHHTKTLHFLVSFAEPGPLFLNEFAPAMRKLMQQHVFSSIEKECDMTRVKWQRCKCHCAACALQKSKLHSASLLAQGRVGFRW